MQQEEWRQVKGFEGLYEVSSFGRVRSLDRTRVVGTKNGGKTKRSIKGAILSQYIGNTGYKEIGLYSGPNTSKVHLIHRLVAEAFIPNPNNYRTVNHKDGNKLNNQVENLEWMSDSDNIKHSYRIGIHKKPVRPIRCVETGKEYNSITEAAEELNGNRTVLSNAIRHGWKFKGYRFEYK